MPQCCVPCCFNRSESKTTTLLSFYRFPCNEKERRKWVQLIRRENFTPNCNSRVCSWHFPNGKAAGPSRFAWNQGKAFHFPDHPSNPPKQKKQIVPSSDDATDTGHTADMATPQTPTTSQPSLVMLEVENDMLREENKKLKEQLEKQKQTFSFSQISSHPNKVQYYTGLPDAATVFFLEALLSRFELQYHSDWTVQIMPLIDQLLLTLMKLKLNCGHVDLATRFNCSTATVTNIFTTIICALYDILCNDISCARIHVERSIQSLKLFCILDHIPYQYRKNINKILKVCVCLTNLQTPILREIQ
ncbi:uncharacterized protein LOC143487050 [Brachyhypopomus gauderio]|uniref:uncharacterized protein LOC143487050 n=1 Tax=Brachyhypopomus gauderio TaxID=698409 RepID=UPI0040434D60